MVRLVKGAYWDTEVKRAQMLGLTGYPVYTRKCNTDVSYLACAAKMLAAPEAFYGQFATHNAHTVATILERAKPGQAFEFQRLHGMGDELYAEVDRTPGPRVPRLCAGRQPRGPAALPRAPPARERRQHLVREPHRRRRRCRSRAWSSIPVTVAASHAREAQSEDPPAGRSLRRPPNSSGFVFADEAVSAPLLAALEPQLAKHRLEGQRRWWAARARTRHARRDPRSVERPAPSATSRKPMRRSSTRRSRAGGCRDDSRGGRARSGARARRRRARGEPRRADGAARARGGQDAARRAGRSARGGGLLPLLRAAGARAFRRARGAARADGRVERPLPRGPRALRVHQPVEFPARDLRGPGRRRLSPRATR